MNRDITQKEQEHPEAFEMHDAIVEGIQDIIAGRSVEFEGHLRQALEEGERREKEGWNRFHR